jgi:N-acetylglucosamine kinase-like BadF-type ATPase
VRTYLGVDGGGSKTAFLLIDESGQVLALHTEGPAYYLEVGWEALRRMLSRGICATLESGAVSAASLDFAFIGLPAYGEDSRLLAQMDTAPSPPLAPGRYRCGNDAACGWAGAFACEDGINLVAGTGSIGYGEYHGRAARAGGWGELFSDEGSAHWIAREGLSLFSRMSDGRTERGPWYEMVRNHFGLQSDLDVCAAIYGDGPAGRSHIAALAPLVARAAAAGDAQAVALFARAADELARIVDAVYRQLDIPAHACVSVSYSGGIFNERALLLEPFLANLSKDARTFRIAPPRLPPVAGAAVYAAKLSGAPLGTQAVHRLESNANFQSAGDLGSRFTVASPAPFGG